MPSFSTSTSTRRFCCRPAAESLSTTGELRAVTFRPDALRRDAARHQHVAHGVGALLGELDVEILVTEVVAVALDHHVAFRVRFEKVRQLVDAPLGAGTDVGLAGG